MVRVRKVRDCRGHCCSNLSQKFGFAGVRLEFLKGQFQLVEQLAAAFGARAKFVVAHLVHQLEIGVAFQRVGIDRPNLGDLGIGDESFFLGPPRDR